MRTTKTRKQIIDEVWGEGYDVGKAGFNDDAYAEEACEAAVAHSGLIYTQELENFLLDVYWEAWQKGAAALSK